MKAGKNKANWKRDDLKVFSIPNEVVINFNNKKVEIKEIRERAMMRVLKQNKKVKYFCRWS